MDGSYSVPAGHLEGGESAREAMVREIREETGAILSLNEVEFAHVMHRNQVTEPHERIDFFFVTHAFTGTVTNTEPEKCDQLAWFKTTQLPATMVEYVEKALIHVINKNHYSEHTEA